MSLYEKIQKLCKNHGFEISNIGDVIPDIKITRGAVSKWKSGAVPRAATLKIIADYFGVSTAYLLEDTEESMLTEGASDKERTAPGSAEPSECAALSEEDVVLLHIFHRLPIMDRAKLLVYAEELAAKAEAQIK